MLQNIPIENILFIDIETVPQSNNWNELGEDTRNLWDKKTLYQRGDATAEEFYHQRAGIMAEFGKIVCISVGMVVKSKKLRIKSFCENDEQRILLDFKEIFSNERMNNIFLCAHNGKEFDFPYISRRMIINKIIPPVPFQNYGKKPWEIQHLDTLDLWKFGDKKNFTSLELLAHVFDIPTPKDDIDGSMVADIYHVKKDLDRIRIYCEKDILTLCNVFMRLRNGELLQREE